MNKLSNIINIDLHIHSNYSSYKEKKDYVKESNIDNVDVLLKELNENQINLFAITDHNRFSFDLYKKLRDKIEENLYKNVLKNLPGIEFDVQIEEGKPSCHIICIFDDSNEEKLKQIENILNKKLLKKVDEYYNKDEFEKILKDINLNVLLIAHQHKNFDNPEGGIKSISNSVSDMYEFIETGYINALEYQKPNVQGMIINCLKKTSTNVATIIGSDCHKWKCYPKKDEKSENKKYITKIKALPTFYGLVFSFTNMENRFNRVTNKSINYFKSIKCKNEEYELSKGINAIIGDNGSGKSFLLQFLDGKEKLPKYYENLKKTNNIEKNIIGVPKTYYVKQNQIIDQVREGKLFKEKDLYNEIASLNDFKTKIKTFAEKLVEYINSNIKINKKLIEINNYSAKLKVITEKLYVPQAKVDIELRNNIYENRILKLNEIKNALDTEIIENEEIYNKYKKEIEIINSNLKVIMDDISKNSESIIEKNYIFNQIILAIKTFNQKMDINRTDKEKEELLYQKEKEKLCRLILEYIELINNKPNKPIFPQKQSGVSQKLYKGFMFIKKAKYDDINMSEIFLEDLFKKGTTFEKLWNINTEDELADSLSGIKRMSDIQTWYNKVDTFIDKYSEEENYIEKNGTKNTLGETPGEISAVHYEFVFNDLSDDYDVLLIDQPENDISNPKIKEELIMHINQIRDSKQIILVTHNPLLVVNLDVDNVICLNKNYKGEISIQDGCLEYENEIEEYKIIKNVADIMDGGKEAIERRFKLYGN